VFENTYHFFVDLIKKKCSKTIDDTQQAIQRLWGRKISGLSHSAFVKILEYTALKTGSAIVKIPRFYPSSKTCHTCGHVYESLKLKDRFWICPQCQAGHVRDLNAAINIHAAGASAATGDTVRPA
jgi:putative transposase